MGNRRPPYLRRRGARMHARPARRRSNPRRLVSLLTRNGAVLEFRIARKLDSPNIWRAHWTIGHNLMLWWFRAFRNALALNAGFQSMARFQLEGHLPPCPKMKMRVTVIRQVPSRRNFIKDDDDLRYTTKPLNDALKHAGLIHDDSREWLDQAMPAQEVSPDGLYWTIVRIEPDEAAALDAEIAALAAGGCR